MDAEKRLLHQLLVEQHQRIRMLLEQVGATRGTDRDQAFLALRRYLATHEAAEQYAVHPIFHAEDREDPSVELRLEEEERVGKALADLESVDVDDEGFDERLGELVDLVRAHAEAEERDELRGFLHRVTTDDVEEMLATLRQVEAVASAMAVADTCENASFEAMLDLARTELEGLSSTGSHG